MADPFLGEIRMFGFGHAPKTWALCNGQFLPINQNQALFALLGTSFGGNGQTTFALPDFRGRIPMHSNQNFHTVGEKAGSESVTINISQLPAHQHILQATTVVASGATGNVPDNTKMLSTSVNDSLYNAPQALVAMNPIMLSTVGGSQPHNNMMPYLTINFCIALIGVFPTLN